MNNPETPSEEPSELVAKQDDGLTDFQVEAKEKTKEIEAVREASKHVKENLAGLNIDPMPSFIEERFKRMGLINKDGSFAIENIKGKLESVALSADVDVQALERLVKREESIRYLLKSLAGGKVPEVLNRDILSSARFAPIEEQLRLKEEGVQALARAKESLEGSVNLIDVADEISKRYGLEFLGPEIIEKFQKSGVAAKDFANALPRELVKSRVEQLYRAESFKRGAYARTLENSRTGIDPGILCLFPKEGASPRVVITAREHEATGGFLKPLAFTDEYLSKTGLIIMPLAADPTALAHEYGHFEDEIFYKKERSNSAQKMREVAAYLSELEMFRDFYEKDYPEVKESVLKDLEDKFLDLAIRAVPGMHKGNTREISREKNSKINDNTKKTFQVAKSLHESGLSWGTIKNMVLHAKTFKDFLQWKKASKADIDELKKP